MLYLCFVIQNGKTPLNAAAQNKYETIIEILIEHGGKI